MLDGSEKGMKQDHQLWLPDSLSRPWLQHKLIHATGYLNLHQFAMVLEGLLSTCELQAHLVLLTQPSQPQNAPLSPSMISVPGTTGSVE